MTTANSIGDGKMYGVVAFGQLLAGFQRNVNEGRAS